MRRHVQLAAMIATAVLTTCCTGVGRTPDATTRPAAPAGDGSSIAAAPVRGQVMLAISETDSRELSKYAPPTTVAPDTHTVLTFTARRVFTTRNAPVNTPAIQMPGGVLYYEVHITRHDDPPLDLTWSKATFDTIAAAVAAVRKEAHATAPGPHERALYIEPTSDGDLAVRVRADDPDAIYLGGYRFDIDGFLELAAGLNEDFECLARAQD